VLGSEHPDVATPLSSLALLYKNRDMYVGVTSSIICHIIKQTMDPLSSLPFPEDSHPDPINLLAYNPDSEVNNSNLAELIDSNPDVGQLISPFITGDPTPAELTQNHFNSGTAIVSRKSRPIAMFFALFQFALQPMPSILDVNLSQNPDQFTWLLLILASKQRLPRIARIHTRGFWTDVFPHLNDTHPTDSFKRHFRLTRASFNYILEQISTHSVYNPPDGAREQTNIEIQVATALLRLATGVNFRELEKFLGYSHGAISNFMDRFLHAVKDNIAWRIEWPSFNQLREIAEGFVQNRLDVHSLYSVAGAIDGSHIPISQPYGEEHVNYINRKGFWSVQLLAIVDHTERFTYIATGSPGAVHDQRLLRNSSFWKRMRESPETVIPPDMYLLGDQGFAIAPWLMKIITIFESANTNISTRCIHQCG